MEKILKNACIDCGGDITVSWDDEMSKCFALAVDICPSCYSRKTCEKCGGNMHEKAESKICYACYRTAISDYLDEMKE